MKEIQKKTAECIDSEGWLHSGDKGCMDARGMLKITGRYKELIIGAGKWSDGTAVGACTAADAALERGHGRVDRVEWPRLVWVTIRVVIELRVHDGGARGGTAAVRRTQAGLEISQPPRPVAPEVASHIQSGSIPEV